MKITPITIRQQIYDKIKHKIIFGEYAYDEKLNIADLVREFEVSNSPIREALSLLEKDGFVKSVPNSGIRVISMNADIYAETVQAMIMIQTGAFYFCMNNGRKSKLLSVMETNYKALEKAIESGDKVHAINANMKFWCSFAMASGNKQLITISTRQFDLYLMAEIYNHRNVNFDYDVVRRRAAALIESVRNDCFDDVRKEIAVYGRFHED